MTLKKQILCAAISSAVIMSNISALAAIPSDVKGTRYEEPVQILNALNIMVGDDTGSFRLDDAISRSEVAKMAVHALGLEDAAEASKGNNDFKDVGADHWANGYIHIATSQNLIVGDGDGNFRPNDTITYAEAMTIMTRAAGYEMAAKEKGGFPNGYMVTGTGAGLAKNVQASTNEKISRGNVAFLTKNALEANMMEQKGYGQNASYEITDKTLLSDVLNVEKAEGQIVAYESASIDSNISLAKNRVKIGDKVFETQEDLLDLLGYNVVYYYETDRFGAENVILAMPIKSQNTTVEIDADVFSKITEKNGNKAIEYFMSETSSKTETAQIASGAKMIFNGKFIEFNEEHLNLQNKSGRIVLLDTTKDGIYDIVFVSSYTNLVVEEVTANNKIVDKYSAQTLKLDEDVEHKIMLGFNEIKLSDLKEYDVLSVYASADKKLYNVVVTRNSVEGKIDAKDDKGFYINNKQYKVAENYTDTVSIGTEGIFYLDIDGRIAAINTANTLSTNYAYLTKAYTDNGTDVSTFKLFTKAGEEKVYQANEKIKFNEASGVQANEVVNALTSEGNTVKQLVTFTTNSDGKIVSINTAVDNTATGNVNKDKFTANYNLTDAVYNAKNSKLGNVRIDDNTVIFNIPSDSDEYEIADKKIFEDNQKYNALVYDMSESFTARAIVLTNSALKANGDAPLAVVSKISSAINSEDEEASVLTVFVNGEEKKIFAENSSILVKGEENKPLAQGDIIQYKTNAKGEIVSIRVLMDIETKATETTTSPTDDLKTVYGKVTKKFTDSINVTVNGGAVTNYSIPSDAIVYSVDTTIAKNNIEVGTRGEIQNYDEEDGRRVFLKIYKDEVTEVVIIK